MVQATNKRPVCDGKFAAALRDFLADSVRDDRQTVDGTGDAQRVGSGLKADAGGMLLAELLHLRPLRNHILPRVETHPQNRPPARR